MSKGTSHLTIAGRSIGEGHPVFIIAEIANCHEGSVETAREMVERIADSGVDAIKFQLHIAEAEMTHDHPKFETQKKRSLTIQELAGLKKLVEAKGPLFLCTPFSREATDLLEGIGVEAFKIGSGEASDTLFLEHVAKKQKPAILSTGMTSLKEIDEAVEIFKKHKTPHMLLHTVSEYPTHYENLNLGTIEMLRNRYQVPVGLSDHTAEIYSAVAAVALGANVIEKHYTLDRNTVGTSDHKVSLEPNEWKELVHAVRSIEKALGEKKTILEVEQSVVEWGRHSVVAARDISAGSVISREDITTKRPLFDAVPANKWREVVGKKAKRDIRSDQRIRHEDVI